MSPDIRMLAAVLAVVAALAAGCSKNTKGKGDDETPTPSPTATPVFASADGNVKFKRAARIGNDFATALGLAPNELCNELGNFSCTGTVHPVALGAVEPYAQGLYEPPHLTGASAPLIVERVALAGCITRVDRDFAGATGPEALFLLDVAGDGTLVGDSASDGKARTAIGALYRRVLARTVEPGEADRLLAMYAEVEDSGSAAPARDWAVLTCFTVLSSTESIFY